MSSASGRQHANVQLQPVIAEILRTGLHPATVNLRIEQIRKETVRYDRTSDHDRDERHGRVIKLLLTDGHLLVQALLHRTLSVLPVLQDLDVGDILKIHKFVVKKAKRSNGSGHVVYLGIDNCHIIKNANMLLNGVATDGTAEVEADVKHEQENCTAIDAAKSSTVGQTETALQKKNFNSHSEDGQGRHRVETGADSHHGSSEANIQHTPSPTNQKSSPETVRNQAMPKRKSAVLIESDSEDGEAFETVRVDTHTAKRRRQALHELSQNVVSSTAVPVARQSPPETPDTRYVHHPDTWRPSAVRFEIPETHDTQQPADIVTSPMHATWLETVPEVPIAVAEDRLQSDAQKSHHVSHKSIASQTPNLIAPLNSTERMPTTLNPPNTLCDTYGPFHDLMRLYSPSLPSKSYVFSALVVPTFVSSHLISRPNSPFPPKRHIKVIDPSVVSKFIGSKPVNLNKGITVSVYRDAVQFKPTIGKVALLRGVVMQRISGVMKNGHGSAVGEVILNIYPVKSRIQRQSQSQQQQQQRTSVQNSTATLDQGDEIDRPPSRGLTSTALHDAVSKSNLSEAQMNPLKIQEPLGNGETRTEPAVEDPWFVDDHDLLRHKGYDVDAMQRWWDGLTAGN